MSRTRAPIDLSVRYREGVEADEPTTLLELYHADALVDTHVPNWRFQLQGREAAAQRACVLPRPGHFTSFDVEPIASGLLVQIEWRQRTPVGEAAVRQLHVWRLVGDLIAEQLVHCAGVWDPRLRELMAAEAPLVRP